MSDLANADPAFVASNSDERTVNNVMRHGYRVLDDQEKNAMQAVKDEGLAFWNLLDNVGQSFPKNPDFQPGSRELSIAKTKIEEAVMWAVKHITA